MPVLKNERHERMAQMMAEGKPQLQSYVSLGYAPSKAAASLLVRKPKMQARILELQREAAQDDEEARRIATKQIGLTRQWVTERLLWLTERTLRGIPETDENGNPTGNYKIKPDWSTSERCLRLAAQINGMLVQRHELGAPGDFSEMSDYQLQEKIRASGSRIGLSSKDLDAILKNGIFETKAVEPTRT